MSVALIVAAARNRVIGKDGAMPWHVPGDLKTFRRLTMGHPIIMGRKTFQSIGKALDGRTNIVVTRDASFAADGVLRAGSIESALEMAMQVAAADGSVMIIGGGEIYAAALDYADTVYLTEIDAEPAGDTWFPALDPDDWVITEQSEIVRDKRDQFAAKLITYNRKSSKRQLQKQPAGNASA